MRVCWYIQKHDVQTYNEPENKTFQTFRPTDIFQEGRFGRVSNEYSVMTIDSIKEDVGHNYK